MGTGFCGHAERGKLQGFFLRKIPCGM